MAKNFPYFKFLATDWLTGDIVYEDLEAQGLFINVCALYWQRDAKLTQEDVNKRYKKPDVFDKLKGSFLKVDKKGSIQISFLDEQLSDANHISQKNSEKGKKSAAAKAAKIKEISTTVEQRLKSVEPNSTKKNKIKEEVKEEVNKRKEEIENKKKDFVASLTPFIDEFGRETLNEFFRYWGEPNKSMTKLKWELQQTWETKLRLIKWKSNEGKFKHNGKSTEKTDRSANRSTLEAALEQSLNIVKSAGSG